MSPRRVVSLVPSLTEAVGFFANDVPSGSAQHTRFGVEETVMDGLILLSWEQEGLERHRYVEVNKLRNTGHARGRHAMSIGRGGVRVPYALGHQSLRCAWR